MLKNPFMAKNVKVSICLPNSTKCSLSDVMQTFLDCYTQYICLSLHF